MTVYTRFQISLPEELAEKLDREAGKVFKARSAFLKDLIIDYKPKACCCKQRGSDLEVLADKLDRESYTNTIDALKSQSNVQ